MLQYSKTLSRPRREMIRKLLQATSYAPQKLRWVRLFPRPRHWNDANDSLENGKSDDSSQNKMTKRNTYRYSSLPGRDNIRLLGLLPHEEKKCTYTMPALQLPSERVGRRDAS